MRRSPSFPVARRSPWSPTLLAICAAILALAVANSKWSGDFAGVWERALNIGIDRWQRFRTVDQWIDDLLVPLLFLSLGLRIKRIIRGRPSVRRPGAHPEAAVIAPAVVPLFVGGGAVLTALSFASLDLRPAAIELAIGLAALLVILNQLNVALLTPYVIVGALLWFALLAGGLSPVFAGIALAAAIPLSVPVDDDAFFERTGLGMEAFERVAGPRVEPWLSRQQLALQHLIEGVRESQSPLFRLEPSLHHAVTSIVPVFLLANAGIAFAPGTNHSRSWILIGTVAVGVFLGNCAMMISRTVSDSGTDPARGSGFAGRWTERTTIGWRITLVVTLILFVAKVLFRDPSSLDSAKIGILLGSSLTGLLYWHSAVGTRSATSESEGLGSSPYPGWQSVGSGKA
jgi:Na+/H+ antiporter NhaA